MRSNRGKTMRSFNYVTVEVFTDRRFGGNPLAVVLDARGMDAHEMQRVATEFNYSESTFVLPPEDPENTARVRIFTPTTEVPFAGHPNVGTAFVLAREATVFGKSAGSHMRFEEGAGIVDVAIEGGDDGVGGARIAAPRGLELGPEIDPALAAACASLPASALSSGSTPIVASVGLPFVFAELESLEALAQATPDKAAFLEGVRRYPNTVMDFALFLYVQVGREPWHLRARMFAPLDNIPEDPATGSASAALAALLASRDSRSDGSVAILIEQGVEMGRRSVIQAEASKRDGIVTAVTVAGACVPVMRGTLTLD